LGTGTKEDKSSTGRVWAAGFHHVTTRSRLARVLKLMNRLYLSFSNFVFGPPQTADTESVDTGARLYIENELQFSITQFLTAIALNADRKSFNP
jgi:hypothetical protein